MAKATTKAKATKAKATKAKTTKTKAKAKSATKATKKKKPSRPAAKAKAAAKASKTELSKLDETGRRKDSTKTDRRQENQPVAVDRRKGHRRRQIDPTTCEREYKEAEIVFMHAMDEYKRASGRMFPTCSEILEVLIKLGYRQVAEPQELYNPDAVQAVSEDDEEVEIDDSSLE